AATLHRIGVSSDVRLACQLRASGNISVVPLVQTERPIYRTTAPQRTSEHEIVMMFCDFLNREKLAREQLPQDLLHLLTLYGDALGNAIRAADGTLISIGPDGVSALFGLGHEPVRAARRALRAPSAIEPSLSHLSPPLTHHHPPQINT